MATHSEREIARVQIDAAIEHYERREFIPAITLAGAAEDILAGLLRKAGKVLKSDDGRFKPTLASLSEVSVRLQELFDGSKLSDGEREKARKAFVKRANRARNALKHHTSDSGDTIEIEDLEEEAKDILDRATSNYWQLELDETPAMQRYLATQLVPQAPESPAESGGGTADPQPGSGR